MRNTGWILFVLPLLAIVSCGGGGFADKPESDNSVSREINIALSASSPRNRGYMDINAGSQSDLAVFNISTDTPDAVVTYDFELYRTADMSDLAASTKETIPQSETQVYTAWNVGELTIMTPTDGSEPLTLNEGQTYYWRAQANVDEQPQGWSALYSFTVKNFCDISGTAYAEHVSAWTKKRDCFSLLRVDPSRALGPPDADGHVSNERPGFGYISIDHAGALTLEMGRAIRNGNGNDVRVWEYISSEWIEVFAADSEIGPWYSMGVALCPDFCDFDLGRTPLRYARYVKIVDMFSEFNSCHQTAGADIDAVRALNMTSRSDQCLG